MLYLFEFRPYRRAFRHPLHTHHGVWRDRSGILLRLQSATGQMQYGEIAPLEWFGTESLEAALAFCRSLPTWLDETTIFSIPAELPACQFGLEAAWEMGKSCEQAWQPRFIARLLPTGTAALEAWRSLYHCGTRTFKWKIGVLPMAEEQQGFKQLAAQLPADVQLRLDANGGLDWEQACSWLQVCAGEPRVEFLEQPLPPSQFDTMQRLQEQSGTAIALDESVAQVQDLERCYDRGWRGIFVVKAAIAGSPQRLREFCQRPGVDVVWSSVFETAIARRYIEQSVIAALPLQQHRALGWGGGHWFENSTLDQSNFEQLWQSF